MNQKSYLSDKCIINLKNQGEIIIEPFNIENVNTGSYDVTLGEWYFREQSPDFNNHRPISNFYTEDDLWQGPIYNMYSEDEVNRVWGSALKAESYKNKKYKETINLENIRINDKIILLGPGETILGHTNEFIGGVSHVITMMKARSSIGRNFIKICSCAGLGDVGYFNRWTMEITNSSRNFSIPLVVGRRLAQIVFFDTDGIITDSYSKTGKYQVKHSVKELQDIWSPYDMLPKLYKDREIKN